MRKMMRRSAVLLTLGIAGLAGPATAQEIAPPGDATRFLLDTGLAIVAGLCAILFIIAYGLRDIGLAPIRLIPYLPPLNIARPAARAMLPVTHLSGQRAPT